VTVSHLRCNSGKMSEMVQDTDVVKSVIRVVSSEISGAFFRGKFAEISGNLFQFFRKFPEIS